MHQFILEYGATYLIYGTIHSGKTSIVKELLNYFAYMDCGPKYVITSSFEDYEIDLDEDIIVDDYNIPELDKWIADNDEMKTIVLDDFLHLCTENGNTARHLKSLMSTTRKKDKQLNIIISAHLLSIGKYIRTLCRVFILLKIDEDSEKFLKLYLGFKKNKIERIKNILIANKYSFLIGNTQGEWKIMKLTF
jgi:hypothetical protein